MDPLKILVNGSPFVFVKQGHVIESSAIWVHPSPNKTHLQLLLRLHSPMVRLLRSLLFTSSSFDNVSSVSIQLCEKYVIKH